MLKYNNYPPREAGDVEFTSYFIDNPSCIDPKVAGHLVARTLLEIMEPRDRENIPAIITHMIDVSPAYGSTTRGIYDTVGCREGDQRTFMSSAEFELQDQGLVGAVI